MFSWKRAVEVATRIAHEQGASQVVAEHALGAKQGNEERFVVGPARGWQPLGVYDPRARVADSDLSLTVFPGWEPPA